jgi:hypothetical protein
VGKAAGFPRLMKEMAQRIPDTIHHLFDRRSWREVSDVVEPSMMKPARVVNVTASVKRMWR